MGHDDMHVGRPAWFDYWNYLCFHFLEIQHVVDIYIYI